MDLLNITQKAEFNYNSETGITVCTLYYHKKTFTGIAKCHPEDRDMLSERVGCFIAEIRAARSCLKYIINIELNPALKQTKHILSMLSCNPTCNSESIEFNVIKRHIYTLEKQIKNAREEIVLIDKNLKEYITLKEKLYKRIRGQK